jgi:hypothetical protein
MTAKDRRQTRPLVREGAPQRQHSNFQTENNIWTQVRVNLIQRLTVSRNMTLTLVRISEQRKSRLRKFIREGSLRDAVAEA